jgi:hypothetical protein
MSTNEIAVFNQLTGGGAPQQAAPQQAPQSGNSEIDAFNQLTATHEFSDGTPPEITSPGTGRFNDIVQRGTDTFLSDLGVPKNLGVGTLIQGAKKKWADAQAGRTEESQMADEVINHIKQGNYGQAAERLLGHIAKNVSPLPGLVQDVGTPFARAAGSAMEGRKTETAGHLMAGAAKVLPFALGAGETGAAGGEAAEAGEAAETAAEVAPKGPGLVQKIKQGEGVAQEPAKQALRTASKAEAGAQATRTMMDEPISALAKAERSTYDAINKAAGTDLKSLYDYREALQDELEEPAQIANKSALEAKLKETEGAINKAEKNLAEQNMSGAELEKARGMTQKRYAMEELKKKLFNNETVVKGNAAYGTDEQINVDAAIRNAENLNKPSRYAREGSPTRLQQALGKDGAKQLLQDLYDAQRAGKEAMRVKELAGKIAKWAAYGGGLAAGGHAILHSVT